MQFTVIIIILKNNVRILSFVMTDSYCGSHCGDTKYIGLYNYKYDCRSTDQPHDEDDIYRP